MHQMQRQAGSSIQAPFSGVLDSSFSLHSDNILGINHMSLEDKSRQAWRSPSPLGQGGAPTSQSNWSQPASSLQYLNALEEAWSEEQELETTSHSIGLQESVGHLVLLIDSFNKGEPNSLQLSSVHVRDRVAETSLRKETGQNKKTPAKLAAQQLAGRNKSRNNCRKVSLDQQTLAQSKSLSKEAKTRGEEQKHALPGVQLTLLSLRGSLTSLSAEDGAEQQHHKQQHATRTA